MPFLSLELTDFSNEPIYPFVWTDSILQMSLIPRYAAFNSAFLKARYADITALYLSYVIGNRGDALQANEFDTGILAFPKLKSWELALGSEIEGERLFYILSQLPVTLESFIITHWQGDELLPEEALELFALIHAKCPNLSSLTLPEHLYNAFYQGLLALPDILLNGVLNKTALHEALKARLPERLKQLALSHNVDADQEIIQSKLCVFLESVMEILPLERLGLCLDSIPGLVEKKASVLRGFIAKKTLMALQLTGSCTLEPREWQTILDTLKQRNLASIDLTGNNWACAMFNAGDWQRLFECLNNVETLNLSGMFQGEMKVNEVLGCISKAHSLTLQHSGLTSITAMLLDSFGKIEGLRCIDLSHNPLKSLQKKDSILFIQLLNTYHVTLDSLSFNLLFCLLSVLELEVILNSLECSASMTLGGNYLRFSQIRGVFIRKIMDSLVVDLKLSWPPTLHKKIDSLLEVFEQLPSVDKLREAYDLHFVGSKPSASNPFFFSPSTTFFQKFENYLSELSLCEGEYEISRKRCESNAGEKNEELTVDSSLPSP